MFKSWNSNRLYKKKNHLVDVKMLVYLSYVKSNSLWPLWTLKYVFTLNHAWAVELQRFLKLFSWNSINLNFILTVFMQMLSTVCNYCYGKLYYSLLSCTFWCMGHTICFKVMWQETGHTFWTGYCRKNKLHCWAAVWDVPIRCIRFVLKVYFCSQFNDRSCCPLSNMAFQLWQDWWRCYVLLASFGQMNTLTI